MLFFNSRSNDGSASSRLLASAFLAGLTVCGVFSAPINAQTPGFSHAPVRPWPKPTTRPAGEGPGFYVDAVKGNDANKGTVDSPWQTVMHGLSQIHSGDTLYLRNGTYREQVTVSLSGKPDAPITIRSYPGEMAVLDGSLKEFFDTPADAWEPVTDGDKDEYHSKRAYPNVRDIIGCFGDSNVGLQSYWPLEDMRADNELWDEVKDQDVKPVYCGPGTWYDQETGYIRIRLAHTHLQGPLADNYEGETDPRKLPLALSTFRSVPLHVDQGKHLRFQDIVIRGGGYDTVVLDHADDVTFDHVTVFCGTYGLNASTTTGLRFTYSALYGNTPPWGFRTENSLRMRKGRGVRDIARLTGHALLVDSTGLEYSVYAYPSNNDWEIDHSSFTDSHDGVYLGGIGMKFHHNRIDNMQDDGMYVSPVYSYGGGKLEIYQNLITKTLTALAFGGPVTNVKGFELAVYRNVFDLRGPVRYGRPTPAKPTIEAVSGHVAGDHGSPPWPIFDFYQNTVLLSEGPRKADMALFSSIKDYPRRVMNNMLVTDGKMPVYTGIGDANSLAAGNLFWGSNLTDKVAATFFDKDKSAVANKSIVGKPIFVGAGDYRPAPSSPGIKAGYPLPTDMPDPLKADGTPDIGALPADGKPLQTGVEAP